MTDQPWHAVRFHGRQAGIEIARRQRAHLIQRARRHHGVEPRVDAAEKFVAIGHQKDLGRAGKIDAGRFILSVPVQQRAAGRQHHFKRARDAGAVAGHQARRRRRIARGEFRMQCGDAFARQPRAHFVANCGGDRRHGGKPAA